MPAGLLLGVDGGQTATVAWIADASGRVLGRGAAGPCNHTKSPGGRRRFVSALRESLQAACREADLKRRPRFASACLGFSGGPADKRELAAELIQAERMLVTTDAEIALAGATGGEPGIVVIAGTGSIALGRNRSGRTARAGGWGYLFGDEGGAFDIARQALRAALRSEEGWGPKTSLVPRLLRATNCRTINDALHLFYTEEWPRDRIAALAPLVSRAAAGGDHAARAVLDGAAASLSELALAVRRQLFRKPARAAITHTGGVFESPIVRRAFERRTPSEPARFPPVLGALILAGLRRPPGC